MTKQIQISNNMVHRLDAIRGKYDNCSYTKAIEYLLEEANNPQQFIIHRLQEIRMMVDKHFEHVEAVTDKSYAFQEAGAKLIRAIHLNDRRHLQHLESLEEPIV